MGFSGGSGGGGSGVIRGHLRPGFSGRSPSFLMFGLLVIAGISAFNYWNLSSQYGDLVKEIAELQDHVRIATLKRENAEKHIDTLQQRLRDTEDNLGRTKIAVEAKTSQLANSLKQIEEKNDEILSLKRLTDELKKLQNASVEESHRLQRQLDSSKMENSNLKEKNLVLEATLADLKEKLAKFPPFVYRAPPIRPLPGSKTVADTNVTGTDVMTNTEAMNNTVKNTSLSDGDAKEEENLGNENRLITVPSEAADNVKEYVSLDRYGAEVAEEDYEAKASAASKKVKVGVNVDRDNAETTDAKEDANLVTTPIGNDIPRFNIFGNSLKEV